MAVGYFLYTRTDAPIPLTPADASVMRAYVAEKKGVVVDDIIPDSPPQLPIWYRLLEREDVKIVLCARPEDLDPSGIRGFTQKLLELKNRGKYLDLVPTLAGSGASVRTIGDWVKPGPNGLVWVDRGAVVLAALDWSVNAQSRAWARNAKRGAVAAKEKGGRLGRKLLCLCGHPTTSKGQEIHAGGVGKCMLCGCPKYQPSPVA